METQKIMSQWWLGPHLDQDYLDVLTLVPLNSDLTSEPLIGLRGSLGLFVPLLRIWPLWINLFSLVSTINLALFISILRTCDWTWPPSSTNFFVNYSMTFEHKFSLKNETSHLTWFSLNLFHAVNDGDRERETHRSQKTLFSRVVSSTRFWNNLLLFLLLCHTLANCWDSSPFSSLHLLCLYRSVEITEAHHCIWLCGFWGSNSESSNLCSSIFVHWTIPGSTIGLFCFQCLSS